MLDGTAKGSPYAEGTAIVLAGGESRRFGADKRMAPWGRGRLVEAPVKMVADLFASVLVATKDPSALAFLERPGVRVIQDAHDAHALGGILTGLARMETPHAFVLGGDMPLVRPAVVRLLWELRKEADAVVPRWGGRLQPLCAVFARACLAPGRTLAARGRFSLQGLLDEVAVKVVEEETVRPSDPTGASFLDADTPAALEEMVLFSVGKTPA